MRMRWLSCLRSQELRSSAEGPVGCEHTECSIAGRGVCRPGRESGNRSPDGRQVAHYISYSLAQLERREPIGDDATSRTRPQRGDRVVSASTSAERARSQASRLRARKARQRRERDRRTRRPRPRRGRHSDSLADDFTLTFGQTTVHAYGPGAGHGRGHGGYGGRGDRRYGRLVRSERLLGRADHRSDRYRSRNGHRPVDRPGHHHDLTDCDDRLDRRGPRHTAVPRRRVCRGGDWVLATIPGTFDPPLAFVLRWDRRSSRRVRRRRSSSSSTRSAWTAAI